MMMQMLQAGGLELIYDDTQEADTSNPNGYFEMEPIKLGQFDWIQGSKAWGKAVKVHPRILSGLPSRWSYKVIYMTRDMVEVGISMKALGDVRASNKSTSNPKTEADLQSAIQAIHDEAHPYVTSQSHFDVLELNYNDILVDPDSAITALDSHLDFIALDTAAMAAIVDPALYRSVAP